MFCDDREGKLAVLAPKEWPDGFFNPANKDRFADVNPILYWKTKEDEMPHEPTFEAARSKVEDAWRFQKARALAKNEAEELQPKARESGGDQQTLKDLAAQYHANYLELTGVARLVYQDGGGANSGKTYKKYEFPKDAIPNTDEK